MSETLSRTAAVEPIMTEDSFDLNADRLHKSACQETSILKAELQGIKFQGYAEQGDRKVITIGTPEV